MKKFLFIFLFLLLSLSFISAAEIEVKEEILKGETLVAKISGNFIQPLTENNIYFYRRHMPTSMGFYDLIKIGDEYYLYVNIPLEKTPDNYSIVVKNSVYQVGTQTMTDDFFGNFTIPDKEVPFTLSPGILITDTNYSIDIQNLEPTSIVVEYKQIEYGIEPIPTGGGFFQTFFGLFSGGSGGEEIEVNYVSLLSGQMKTVEIAPQDYLGFQEVEFNYENDSYSVLIWVEEFVPEPENETTPENETEPENVTIGEDNVTVEDNETEEKEKETFWELIFGKDDEENITEEDNGTIGEGEEEIIIPDEGELKTCDELGGQICESGFKCESNTVYAEDAKCCLVECVSAEKSSTGKTIGWVIIIAVALFLTWFFKKKFKKKQKPVDLLKIGSGKK